MAVIANVFYHTKSISRPRNQWASPQCALFGEWAAVKFKAPVVGW
jgi:hypothetical protein